MSATATKAIKSFRISQLKGFKKYLKHNGPLPPTPALPAGSPPVRRLPNPFVPHRNPMTGRWAPAAVSLRRQADLVKRAKESDTLYLLPPGPKAPQPSSLSVKDAMVKAQEQFARDSIKNSIALTRRKSFGQIWMRPVEWVGVPKLKQVPGADLGTRLYAGKKRMFKGHKWERLKEAREQKRKILVRDMPRRIRNYKSYYRRRRPNPLKPSSSTKAKKLPF